MRPCAGPSATNGNNASQLGPSLGPSRGNLEPTWAQHEASWHKLAEVSHLEAILGLSGSFFAPLQPNQGHVSLRQPKWAPWKRCNLTETHWTLMDPGEHYRGPPDPLDTWRLCWKTPVWPLLEPSRPKQTRLGPDGKRVALTHKKVSRVERASRGRAVPLRRAPLG